MSLVNERSDKMNCKNYQAENLCRVNKYTVFSKIMQFERHSNRRKQNRLAYFTIYTKNNVTETVEIFYAPLLIKLSF